MVGVLFLSSPASSSACKAVVGSSSCLHTGSFWGIPHQTCWNCGRWPSLTATFLLRWTALLEWVFFCSWHSMFCLLQEAEISVSLVLTTSNHVPPTFVLLACWSWKCNLLLFCLCCSINYWILPRFSNSEPDCCWGCSKQVFCTSIFFTSNLKIVFSTDCKKRQGFFGCWICGCFDPGREFKRKCPIYKGINAKVAVLESR